jgi:predicted Zn-dependent protease
MKQTKSTNHFALSIMISVGMLAFALTPCAFGQRTKLKPGGWNLFSTQQDVELGLQVSQDAEKKLVMLNNQRVDDYLDRLGKRLAAVAPGAKYPYQFKCVNDSSINAFALPGGFLYINRGTIEAADNEAELAGVIGHEIGHVALRHGTNQATKQYIAQVPLAILGGTLGSKSIGAIAAQVGGGVLANCLLLKYSRDDERQSDLMGTQILFDSGYDPNYVAQFFEKLGEGKGTDFFSSHPNPENRIKNITNEIDRLGTPPSRTISDSSEFRSIKRLVQSLPPAPKAVSEQTQTSRSGRYTRPARPSSEYKSFNSGYISLNYPDNWKASGNNQQFTLVPDGGIVSDGNSSALAYGATAAVLTLDADSDVGLKDATNQLVVQLQRTNSGMRITQDRGQVRIGGKPALWKILSNNSPIGGRETNWLITTMQPEGLVYFILVAPEQEFADYENAFREIISSVDFGSQ